MIASRISHLFLLLTSVHLVVQNIPLAVGRAKIDKNVHGVFASSPEMEIETGELAVVRLISHPRSRRDLSQKDYHILEIDVPSKKKNLQVHIMKTDELASPFLKFVDFCFNLEKTFVITENGTREQLSETEDSHSDCLYTGTISGDSEGAVALSSCNSNPPGFVGMIKSGDEHLFIEPKILSSTGNLNTSEAEIIHVVHTADKIVPGGTFSDVKRVPTSELEAAIALMAKQFKKFKNDTDTNSGDEENQNTLAQTMDLNGNSETGADNGILLETLAYKSDKSATGTKVVEIAIFCDSKMYSNYKKKYSKDTLKKMKDFTLTLVNCMCLLYKDKSLGLDVQFSLVLLEIFKSDPRGLKVTSAAEPYLKNFCTYAGGLNTNGESWDHALLLTGLDIEADGEPLVAGLAYAGTMCLQFWSCSISEAESFGCVYTISHELGHSLGMDHDGYETSYACDSEKYIMSPTTGPGKTRWSSCSRDNAIEFFKTGNNIVGSKSRDGIPVCLTKTSKKKPIKFSSSKLPGEKYPAKTQCILSMGNDHFPWTEGAQHSDVCYMLYCARKVSSTSIGVIPTHPALEGTSCGSGSGKKCRSGKCT